MSAAAPGPAGTVMSPGAGDERRPRLSRRAVAGLAVVAVGAGSAWAAGAFRSGGLPGRAGNGPAVLTATVTRQDLSSQTSVPATMGYAGSYTVTGHGGTLTWLPAQGRMIGQGQVLYRVDDDVPVMLLYGPVPAWRALAGGETGADVAQLNRDLVHLGYAGRADIAAAGRDYFSWATTVGVAELQRALGITTPPGSLALGSVVFEPSALRITAVPASLGDPASGAVLAATSTRPVVAISLNADQQTEVRAGAKVTVTLPDGSVTPGVISSVGTVASGSGSSATIPVYVRLTHPHAAGRLDQAPVTVQITTGTVSEVLTVPVGALLAQSGGGYAVEVAGLGAARHLAAVTTGLFDDASGLVQVTGTGLAVGQHVVVPSA